MLKKILEHNLETLKEEFRSALQTDETQFGYSLNFVGKEYAKLQTARLSETVIVPDTEHNALPENVHSKNVFITGDNLEALRHLQLAYREKIKVIYIDPPYNTGKEFTYSDRFELSDDELEEYGYDEKQIERLKSLQGKSSHSAWLTFMYPRLKLAQKLLRPDGVIFVSIDDNEQANLKLLMDDVFGESNFEATVIPIVNPGGRDYKQVAITNEYLLIYAKTPELELNEIEKGVDFQFYDKQGGFNFRELRNRNPKFHSGNRPNLFYSFYVNPIVISADGYCAVSIEKLKGYSVEVKPYNSEGRESVWRWGKTKASENIVLNNTEQSQILAKQKQDGNWNIYEKSRKSTTKVKSHWDETEMRTENGTREIRELFAFTPFDHPKPIGLIKRCIQMGCTPIVNLATDNDNESDIILDFFAGSGTTAHAVMQLNAEDDGHRHFILVQLDEKPHPDSEARKVGYQTIDEVARERIKRAAKKIVRDGTCSADTGFKHFRLKTLDEKTLDKIIEFNPDERILFATGHAPPLTVEAIRQTWLIDDGYPFDENVQTLQLAKYDAYFVERGGTLYLMNEHWNTDALKSLLNKIGRDKLPVSTVIVSPYSFGFEELRELKTNLKTNLDRAVKVIERF